MENYETRQALRREWEAGYSMMARQIRLPDVMLSHDDAGWKKKMWYE